MRKKRQTVSATPEGLAQAEKPLKRLFDTQSGLINNLEGSVGRSTIQRFFQGKDIEVGKFKAICKALTLESQWEAIAGLIDIPDLVDVSSNSLPEQVLEKQHSSINIDALVQEVREKIKPYIQERCGTMRVLDMTQPIGLGDIYTDVNILEKRTGRTGREIGELSKNLTTEDFDRFGLGKITQERVPGLQAVEQHSKLMVLGKPGAGKTTFLKYLAMQCIEGNFQGDRIPIFITLKDFAEQDTDLLVYLTQLLADFSINSQAVKQLIEQGRLLALLDGLDEVKEANNKRILNQIKDFTFKYHQNQFVITCRIAAQDYIFENFTDVTIADFNSQQIETFANNWFTAKNDISKAKEFIFQLEKNATIKELATIPLLLTLLCLVFERKGGIFPESRATLYEEALEALLEKWDATRGVERDQLPYKNLSLKQRKDLLTQIAYPTFENGKYFFEPEEVQDCIIQYYESLNIKDDIDTKKILESIEAQHGLLVERTHGIYSFSHLTFHEYFTAREIKERSAWAKLAEHIAEKQWREVFLLTVGMERPADDLLKSMKQKIDALLTNDDKLQQFLTWVDQKSKSVETRCKAAAARAFYLALALNLDRVRALALNLNLERADLDFNLDRVLDRVLDRDRDLVLNLNLDCVRSIDLVLVLDPELKRSLQQLKAQLPNPEDDEAYKQWWQENGQAWTKQLRDVMIEHRNIGHDWQFTDAQKELLEQYYDANKLLVDCLNSDCYVSREVRQEIEDTLLLPVNRSSDTSN